MFDLPTLTGNLLASTLLGDAGVAEAHRDFHGNAWKYIGCGFACAPFYVTPPF